MNAAVAKTELKVQLRCRLPRVLNEELIHVGPVRRLVAGADLGVGIEESERCVCNVVARSPSVSTGKVELAILIVGLTGSGIREGNLVVIVLPGAFVKGAGAED